MICHRGFIVLLHVELFYENTVTRNYFLQLTLIITNFVRQKFNFYLNN